MLANTHFPFIVHLFLKGGGAIRLNKGETVVNDCIFLDNSGVTTALNKFAGGGAIGFSGSNLKVFDSIFKNNKEGIKARSLSIALKLLLATGRLFWVDD